MSLIQMSVSASLLIAVVTIIRFIAMHSLPKKLMLIWLAGALTAISFGA